MKKYILIFFLAVATAGFAQQFPGESKVLILEMRFEKNNLSIEHIGIRYGSPPNRIDNSGLAARLLTKNITVGNLYINDPRIVYDVGYIENISFAVVLPYKAADTLEIIENNRSIARTDIAKSFIEFCGTRNNICDPDCAADIDCNSNATTSTLITTTTLTSTIKAAPASTTAMPLLLLMVLVIILALIIWYGYRKFRETKILRMRRR